MTGFEVLADRMVLQALKDPLMHVLRNAVTHGIELPAERTRRGKAATGLVTLTINAVGNRLTIAVEDDGRGVDLIQTAEIAVRCGIFSESDAAAQSPADLARLLFQPGFTTSRVVTELSGRGMGLSAVYEAVNRLQGEVEMRPRDRAGASVLIAVPFHLDASAAPGFLPQSDDRDPVLRNPIAASREGVRRRIGRRNTDDRARRSPDAAGQPGRSA